MRGKAGAIYMLGFTLRSDLRSVLKKNAGSWAWKIFRSLLLIGISYIFLFPVLYMISVSIRHPDAVNDPSSIWIPRKVSLESIKTAMEVLQFGKSVTQTLIIAVGGTIASLLSCSLVGYGFARFKFKEKNIAFALLLLTIIVPPQTIVMSSFLNFRFFDFFGILKLLHRVVPAVPENINLSNTPLTFIMPALFASGLRSGLFVYIFRQFFLGMPSELEEAARIDGCGSFSTFFKIIIPLANSAFITVLLFSFIWHWNDFYLSTIYYNDNYPISVMLNQITRALQDAKIYNISTNTPDQIRTYLQAGSLLTISIPLIIYIFTQRFFTESIERTGVVG